MTIKVYQMIAFCVSIVLPCPVSAQGTRVSPNQIAIGNLVMSGVDTAIHIAGTTYACNDVGFAAAITAAASTGQWIIADGCQGAIPFASSVVFPSGKAIRLQLGNQTITGPCPIFDLQSAADGSVVVGLGTSDLTGSSYTTKLVCSSGTDGIRVGNTTNGTPRLNGIEVGDMAINCNSQATNGLIVDTVFSSWFHDMNISNCTNAITLQVSNTNRSGAALDFGNRFEGLSGSNDGIALNMTNNTTGGGNNTQESFINLQFNFTGKAGIYCSGCDNNWFSNIRMFRTSGSGDPILLVTPNGFNPLGALNNHFYGIIGNGSGLATIHAQTGTYGNTVWGEDYLNGESFDKIDGNGQLIVNGKVLCGPSGCPGISGTNPNIQQYIATMGNCGNLGNPTWLIAIGVGICNNLSNGGGETDLINNPGAGTTGGFNLYNWNSGSSKMTLNDAFNSTGLLTTYNRLTTAGQGVPVILGATSQKSESAADSKVLAVTPASLAGNYRACFTMSVSAANAATLGWTATWTDSNGNAQAPTNLPLFQDGTAAPALTFTTSAAGTYQACKQLDVDNSGTNIVIKLTFSGISFTAKVSATVERII